MNERQTIAQIDKDTVRRICSGQVITEVGSAVKELVENSLDAGAKSVTVRLIDHGMRLIEVSDDGRGIAEEDWESVALPHATSKLSSLGDLGSLSTFGFRGEALASLCSTSASVEILTRTADREVGARLRFDRGGRLVSREPLPRTVGTTVAVSGLFEPLPVRAKELARNAKKELAKAVSALQSYAVACEGVRVRCFHEGEELLCTEGGSLRENVARVFGSEFTRSLADVDVVKGDQRVRGLVSKGGAGGRSTSDRQMLFLNSRPVELPRIAKQVNSLFHSLLSRSSKAKQKLQFPSFVFLVTSPPGSFDLNVTPDKRTVLLRDEAPLLELILGELTRMWEPTLCDLVVGDSQGRAPQMLCRRTETAPDIRSSGSSPSVPARARRVKTTPAKTASGGSLQSKRRKFEVLDVPRSVIESAEIAKLEDGREVRVVSDGSFRSLSGLSRGELVVPVDVAAVLLSARNLRDSPAVAQAPSPPPTAFFTKRVGLDDDAECERELELHFSKDSFSELEVCGQFNLGFIVARRGRELFIVDQHASDEIRNFEELRKTTALRTQPLISPLPLELSAEDEILVMESLDTFREHGFVMGINGDAPPGRRIQLKSCVFSKSSTFGLSDIYELVAIMKDDFRVGGSASPALSQQQLSRVRAMLASRACRRSVMIGTALTEQQMKRILQRMSNLESPWRCPHGRPTVRHLCHLPNPQRQKQT